MNNLQLYNVAPAIPPELEFLERLSYNLWWCWNPDAIELFRRIDPQGWKQSWHNPFRFLSSVPQETLEKLSKDDGFMSHYQQVQERFDAEVLHGADGKPITYKGDRVAYFSLEYGIHESVRVYSGGLGCLAGDHLKAASDMGLPLVAVGLMYRRGYCQQYLTGDGWQQERYDENEINHLPLRKAVDSEKRDIIVSLPVPDGVLHAAVWRMDVGRIPLYLLDTNIPENSQENRRVTFHLYDGDRSVRLRQELLLGIGGFRALLALGYEPSVCHMNEGHAAFLGLARLAYLVQKKGLSVEEAMEVVPRSNVFTTHTPVPAGNETFPVDMLRPYLAALEKEIGIDPNTAIAWGQPISRQHPELSMTILGLRVAHFANGVSRLHGKVARKMWSHLWPERPEDEIPIGHVTNGVHVSSWLSPDQAVLFDRYLGPEWRDNPAAKNLLSRVDLIPDEELWRAHELGRSRLVRFARELGEKQLTARNASQAETAQIKSVLRHDVLTIGFARRFAAYKRAALILKDPQRFEAILTDKQRPVQIVFAGKAHPADNVGKELIRRVVEFARRASVRHRIIFLENYDIRIARYMVQGVDVWLNTPRRPEEASGTSGMKAAVNGALHASILDGWWDEGYNGQNGWAIGQGEESDNQEYLDSVEAQAMYNLIESSIVPCFYDRSDGDVPGRWLRMMKESIRTALGSFTSHRMVAQYHDEFYKPAMAQYKSLLDDGARKAKAMVETHSRFRTLWKHVRITPPKPDREISQVHVGDKFTVVSEVHLGELKPEEVDVQIYYGPVNLENKIDMSNFENMVMAEKLDGGRYSYKQQVACKQTGRFGLTARVMPCGREWKALIPGFVAWADGTGAGSREG